MRQGQGSAGLERGVVLHGCTDQDRHAPGGSPGLAASQPPKTARLSASVPPEVKTIRRSAPSKAAICSRASSTTRRAARTRVAARRIAEVRPETAPWRRWLGSDGWSRRGRGRPAVARRPSGRPYRLHVAELVQPDPGQLAPDTRGLDAPKGQGRHGDDHAVDEDLPACRSVDESLLLVGIGGPDARTEPESVPLATASASSASSTT